MRPAATAPAIPKPSHKAPAQLAPTPSPTHWSDGPTQFPAPTPIVEPTGGDPDTAPGSQPPQQQFTHAEAVVDRHYQDITNHGWQDTRALGRDNIAAQNGQ